MGTFTHGLDSVFIGHRLTSPPMPPHICMTLSAESRLNQLARGSSPSHCTIHLMHQHVLTSKLRRNSIVCGRDLGCGTHRLGVERRAQPLLLKHPVDTDHCTHPGTDRRQTDRQASRQTAGQTRQRSLIIHSSLLHRPLFQSAPIS